jgi:hypothetical protein
MTFTWECTAHTHSERIVTRSIQASGEKVARAKMRWKLRNKVYSVNVRLAAEQITPMPRFDAAAKALIKRKLSI